MDKLNTIFDTEAVRKLHAEMDKTILSFPIWMRLNYLSNTVNDLYKQGYTDADIDWDKVNEILTTNVNEYDFNNFDRIETSEQLSYTRMMCIQNSILRGVWQVHTCKDCGEEFVMKYHEVMFYENKGLHVPKRCKACRDKRRTAKNTI